MIRSVKKVIRASAGTGKTYRLSLEYIGLLLQFFRHGLHFSEILVITFTKKATAEIRERIFSQLRDIIDQNESGQQLEQNLTEFFGLSINEDERRLLRGIYVDMLTNKQQVQISTIDSFTHTIFKTIIAPYLGITDFDIKTQIDDFILDELYRSILEDEAKLSTFRSFFERSELKKINDYEAFIQSVIRNRWVFHLIRSSQGQRSFEELYQRPDILLDELKAAFADFGAEFQKYLNVDHAEKSAKDVLLGAYFSLLYSLAPTIQLQDVESVLNALAADETLLAKHASLLLDDSKNVWHGGKLLRKKTDAPIKERLSDFWAQTRRLLADYLFAAFLLPEEKELLDIADFVIQRYDELKFRDKVFTHDDISYLTFKYLYDPELSLIDRDYVANSFYEHLSALTRFVLIDEFQDTSILQYKILLPIIREVISGAGIKEYGGAIVVGDEKQSIYGWRGGERDLLLKMPQVMHEGQDITLDTSYRSDENIITFVNALFAHSSLQQSLENRSIDWAHAPIHAAKKNGLGHVGFFLRNFSRGQTNNNKISTEEEAIREFLRGSLGQLLDDRNVSIRNTAILARRNKDLDAIAHALDEMGVRYMQESSRSILDHQAIKPVYLLFRFLVYGDFYDLLSFLRSDIVLLDAGELKELLLAYRDAPEKSNSGEILRSCLHIADVNKLHQFLVSVENFDIFLLAQRIVEEYNIIGRFDGESDAKNIDHFLMLISSFCRTNREYPISLKGFLDYCGNEKDSDLFNQVGLDEVNAISLMTIHKSKGLEFDNVFLYWNLSSGQWTGRREMHAYLEYATDYSSIQNYLLAFNYNSIIEHSSQSQFVKDVERRQAIEELNNFYVALTRAKSNLFLGFTYKKSDGFAKLFDKNSDKTSMALLFVEHVRSLFAQQYQFHTYDLNRDAGGFGEIVPVSGRSDVEQEKGGNLADYLNTDRKSFLVVDKERQRLEEHVDFKSVFLKSRAVDIGSIVHYYLSFIKRGTSEEKESAKKRTLTYYGSLLSADAFPALFQDVDVFIKKNDDLFSRRWSHIFTEHTMFTTEGKEIRIDRMMVDEDARLVHIVDFKTGHLFEEEQIETYIAAIKSLPIVNKNGYTIEGYFRKIELPSILNEGL